MYNYSIILPYYDKYNLFVKAFDSIPDRIGIQIIIVDNSKKTLEKEEIPSKTKALVTYTTSDNTKGAGHARNVGLSLVQGKYTLFCDADDYFTETAFNAFDKYVEKEFDIVFFKSDSINLSTNKQSNRHLEYNRFVDLFLNNENEDYLRYRYEAPWGKLYKTSFLNLDKSIAFKEIKVNNDAWFSLMTGHKASKIYADNSVVYVISEGEQGTSLTMLPSLDNIRIRYSEAIKTNKFLKSCGHYDMRIRLLGYIRMAIKQFGILEGIRFTLFAIKNRLTIF